MRTTYWVPGARRRGISLAAGLALLCLAGTLVSSSPATAAEAAAVENELLTTGDGYAQPQGSPRVRALQRRLRTLGLRPGPVDGFFGPETKAAVEGFQRALGLAIDGIVGPRTRQALRRSSAPMLGRGMGYGEPLGSVRVRRLQRELRGLGMRPGPVDGLYGPLTAAAVARFQRARGARPDGVAWGRTRRAIARAPRLDANRLARGDGTAAPRTGEAQARTRPARDSSKPRAFAYPTAREPESGSSGSKEPTDVGLLVLSGLLAFMFVAAAAPLARRVATAPVRGMPEAEATPPEDDSSYASAEPPRPRAAPKLEEESHWQEEADQPVQAVGYVTATEATRAKAELRRQITALDAACERGGWRLVEVARDIGDSADAALDRPGLNYALERLADADRSCLIVAELRRLGESAAELGHVLRWLRDQGLRLVAVDVELDTAAPDGRIAADALISVGERAERGPRKSRVDSDVREPQHGRAAVRDLPELREHIVAMRSAGMTLQAIADRLNEEGVPTLRGGREWRPSSVQVAAGYRRPRRLSSSRNVHDRSAERRRLEDR
jgi:peptidoglycan hydrolase-like protein with peptidoglycan-binding domain/DNA invertase Pin-like site-specific DNA recombinase